MQDEADGVPSPTGGDSHGADPKPVATDHCHCNGHRLIVVIGNKQDNSISAALTWALAQTTVEHRIFYSATSRSNDPHYTAPLVPNGNNTEWDPYTPPQPAPAHPPAVGVTCMLCCFYQEVIVIAHGSQQGIWSKLLGTQNEAGCLGFVLNGKPTQRFVLWVCDTGADIYPHKGGAYAYFEWLAYFIGPPASCPCGCDPALCQICPHTPGCVTLLSAAWYDAAPQHWSAKLGMDPSDTTAPFTSPDGRLLNTQICATQGGGTTTESSTMSASGGKGITVFNGLRVKAEPSMEQGGRAVSPENHTGAKGMSRAIRPSKFDKAPYVGPMACPDRYGCLH